MVLDRQANGAYHKRLIIVPAVVLGCTICLCMHARICMQAPR